MWEGHVSQSLRADCGGLYIVKKYLLSSSPFHGREALPDVIASGFGHGTCFGQKNEVVHSSERRTKEDHHFSAYSLVLQLSPREGNGQASILAIGGRRESRGVVLQPS